MADYHTFTTNRATKPNSLALVAAVRAAVDASVGISVDLQGVNYRAKKETLWTAPQIAAAQTALDTCAADTPQLTAQQAIDAMSIFEKAIILTILDQLNLIRSKLPTPLGAITVAQMIQAVRDKAGTL
jgi:hypothetical protein